MDKKEDILQILNKWTPNTLMETLGIRYTDLDRDKGWVEAQMEVTPRIHQPMGLLHGGATAALIESLGSASSAIYAPPPKYGVVGIHLECNHIKSVKTGRVTARAEILHRGRRTHLWKVDVKNEEGQLIATGKLTNMILQNEG